MLSDFFFRVRSLLRRREIEAELDDELRFHLEREVEKRLRSGLARDEARRQARLHFGGFDQVKEECRDARGVQPMENLFQDVRYALRMLRKKPAFTLVAILTLAIGVGANTAIFSIVNTVLLRSLPYRDPGRLVQIFFNNPGIGLRNVPFSIPEYDDLRTRAGLFEDVYIAGRASVNLTGGKQPERLEMQVTTPNYFTILGATPQIGRLFGPQDFALGFAPVTVLSDAVWHRSYAADPTVLGRTLRLDNDPYTIIGVLPPGFRPPALTSTRDVEVFQTAGFAGDPAPAPKRSTRFIPSAIGRLKPGTTLRQAQARLAALAAEIRQDYPGDYPAQARWTIEVRSLQESLVGNVRPMLLVLFGAVMLIVFIVSLNIANLSLARASGRQQEMAIRSAMGASRGRIVAQMLTESVLLSLIGGAFGIATALSTLQLILRFVPRNIPRLNEVSIDWTVLAFAFTVSLITGLLFGLAPAVHSAKSSLSSAMREGARGSGYSARTSRMRDALIVCEVALAVVLMTGAGLLLRSLQDLLQQDPGFNATQIVAARVSLPEPNDPNVDPYLNLNQQAAFNSELLRRMNAIPGVQLAAIASVLPTAAPLENGALAIENRPEFSEDLRAEMIRVSPDYFRVLETPLLRGRFFSAADIDGQPVAAIIDESTARRYWPDRDPVGHRIRFGQNRTQPWMAIVGIVKDIKTDGLDIDGVPHVYVSTYQRHDGTPSVERDLNILLRTSLTTNFLEPKIRKEVQSIDPALPVFDVTSMDRVVDRSLASRRFSAELVGGFAAVALLLASIGIYGLLAYIVGQRSHEIGLRIALGAPRAGILKMIVSQGMILAAAGIVAGVIFSASTASLMASLLYGIRPHDPAVFLAVPLVLFAVALLASFIPARRAARLDPMAALRES